MEEKHVINLTNLYEYHPLQFSVVNSAVIFQQLITEWHESGLRDSQKSKDCKRKKNMHMLFRAVQRSLLI